MTVAGTAPQASLAGPPSRASRHLTSVPVRRRLRAFLGVGLAVGVWALATGLELVSHDDLPTIGAVARAVGDSSGDLVSSLGTTLESMFIGLAIAAALATVLGVLVGLSAWADAATDILVRMMRPLPSLALIPIAILVAGLGTTMTAGLTAFAAFWPVFINARYATRQVDRRLLDTAAALGLGRLEVVRRVIAPSVAPAVATGVRISAGIAIVVTISVELVAGTGGLGGYVLGAEQGGATAQVYAGILAGGVAGWLINLAFGLVARRALPWDFAAERGRGR